MSALTYVSIDSLCHIVGIVYVMRYWLRSLHGRVST